MTDGGALVMTAFVKILTLSPSASGPAPCASSRSVALPTIEAMRRLAQTSGNWLNLRTEQEGTRLAGEFLDVVFAKYFPFQVVCGIIALITACWWLSQPGWIAKIRVALAALALALAACNLWVCSPRVHELRQQRYGSDADAARVANEALNSAHTISLSADMAGFLCVLTSLILVLWLPKPDGIEDQWMLRATRARLDRPDQHRPAALRNHQLLHSRHPQPHYPNPCLPGKEEPRPHQDGNTPH